MKSREAMPESGAETKDVGHKRMESAFKELRGSPVGQAYWYARTVLSKPGELATFSEDEQEAIREACRVLEESPELKALSLIANVARQGEQQFPGSKIGMPERKGT